MSTLRHAAIALRQAQQAYLEDRGNEEKGQAVAIAAAALDEALRLPEPTPENLQAALDAIVEQVGAAWDAGSLPGSDAFLGSLPAARQVLLESLPDLAAWSPEHLGIQEAWEAAGGNPGIRATRTELLETLKLLDEAVDEADVPAAQAVAWRTEWQGDHSDLNATIFAANESELDDEHAWEPLFARPAPSPLFVHVAWRNQIGDQWVYFPSTFDPRNAHDNGKPYEKVYALASFEVLIPRLEQSHLQAQGATGNAMLTLMAQEVASALGFLRARQPSPELVQRLGFVRDAIKPLAALEGMSATVQHAIDTLTAGPALPPGDA